MVQYRWLRNVVRRYTQPIAETKAEMWKRRLSIAYMLIAWNAFGVVLYQVYNGKANWATYHGLPADQSGPGTTALAIGHPFDTIKVRQQVLHAPLWQAIKHTFVHEGIRGFYKGFLFPSLLVGPSNAVFFGFYGGAMKFIAQDGQHVRVQLADPHWQRNVFIAGSFAGFWQCLFTCPMEVVKTTLQMQTKHMDLWKATHESKARGLVDCIVRIWRERFTWYFRGLTPMMFRDCPTSGVYVLVYEELLNAHYALDFMDHSRVMRQIWAGGMAGVISWVIVIPFDVIKSRMQGDNMLAPVFRSTFHCVQVTYREKGWRYFFQGGWPVVLRAFPFNAGIFVTYEYCMDVFRKYEIF